MSELFAEDKKKLLRERRQARMAQGNASQRLNNILSQGSSVKASTVSILDKPKETPAMPITHNVSSFGEETPLHSDPEVPDISTLMHNNSKVSLENEDMDEMLQKIFSAATQATGDTQGPEAGEADNKMFAQMMKMMTDGVDIGGTEGISPPGQDTSMQTKMAAFHAYEQRRWKVYFLIVRLVLHTANFLYHYWNYPQAMQSSPHFYVRDAGPANRSFIMYFVTCEIAVISTYFLVLSKNGLLRAFSKNHAISKLISMVSMVVPQVQQYQPMVDTLLVYWEGVSILMGDISLVVVLFGLVSILGR